LALFCTSRTVQENIPKIRPVQWVPCGPGVLGGMYIDPPPPQCGGPRHPHCNLHGILNSVHKIVVLFFLSTRLHRELHCVIYEICSCIIRPQLVFFYDTCMYAYVQYVKRMYCLLQGCTCSSRCSCPSAWPTSSTSISSSSAGVRAPYNATYAP
jgi:hypothetical protein